jgi:protein gp37
MSKTKIEWTEKVWNPVTGCDRVSAGCKNCYAERMAKRLQAMGQPRYERGFQVALHWDLVEAPLRWSKPSVIFVNSMSDLFHPHTGARKKFLSCEPLLGPLDNLNLDGIDWVIVGGESGPGARPMRPDWARGIRDKCAAANVPFFFKQWGGAQKKRTGRELDGRTWDEVPRWRL